MTGNLNTMLYITENKDIILMKIKKHVVSEMENEITGAHYLPVIKRISENIETLQAELSEVKREFEDDTSTEAEDLISLLSTVESNAISLSDKVTSIYQAAQINDLQSLIKQSEEVINAEATLNASITACEDNTLIKENQSRKFEKVKDFRDNISSKVDELSYALDDMDDDKDPIIKELKKKALAQELNEFKAMLWYNPRSPSAPIYINPIRESLTEIESALETGEDIESIEAETNTLENHLTNAITWFENWNKIRY